MSIFTLESKKTEDIPLNCREIIKQYKKEGMFNIDAIIEGKQEYTTLYFILTQDCNLHCDFCYQPKEFRQKKYLTYDIVDDTMKFAIKNFDEKRLKFSLFGGEPFLNYRLLQYILVQYPMFRYVVTTNGLLLLENQIWREWITEHKYHLNLSVSIRALRQRFGDKYLEETKPLLDLVKETKGDIHYVIDNPSEQNYEEIKYLLDYGIPIVRISPARHWDLVKEKNQEYIDLFKKIADYVYFIGKPKFGRTQWDIAFRNNIYKKLHNRPVKSVPPTFCGCGYLYLAINDKGDLYPCDFFINFPEFKIGDIYNGFNETALFFKKMGDWIEDLYENCRNCLVCDDIRLCPRAMCLAENYLVTGNPLKPAPNHCWANKIEYSLFDYIAKKSIETGIDKVYEDTYI